MSDSESLEAKLRKSPQRKPTNVAKHGTEIQVASDVATLFRDLIAVGDSCEFTCSHPRREW